MKFLLTLLTKIIVVEAEAVPTTTTPTTNRTPIITTIAGKDRGKDSSNNTNINMVVTVGMLATVLHQWCRRMLRWPRPPVLQEEEEAEIIIAKEDDPPMKGVVEVVDEEDDHPMEVDAITIAIVTTIRTVADEVVAVDKVGVVIRILTTVI